MTKLHSPYNQDGVIVAIDGPAGAGKSTIAKALALDLNYMFVDTGAMYRAVTFAALEKNVSVDDESAVEKLLPDIEIEFRDDNHQRYVFLNGREVTEEIRNPDLYPALAKISSYAVVRRFLVDKQRAFAEKFSIVMEGRDIGSVVFPNATVKFYLTAKPEVRAKRRFLELKHKGLEMPEDVILKEIIKRDKSDSTRKVSPLTLTKDAIEIDSSTLNAEGVVQLMLDIVKAKTKKES